jgi:hypothetical protein
MGIVTITSSSTWRNHPSVLFDDELSDYWYSKDESNSWIVIEFKDISVRVSHYSLESSPGGSNCFREWILSGSLDEGITDDLVGSSKVQTFAVNTAEYVRYVRLEHTGQTTSGRSFSIIAHLELFGKLRRLSAMKT